MAISYQPTFTAHSSTIKPRLRLPPSFRPNVSLTSTQKLEFEPVYASVKSFAPATIANLGPGFDFLGCAVDGIGNYVTLEIDPHTPPGEISISDVTKNINLNCALVAATALMKTLGVRSVGLSLSLEEGVPLGSGLGSSAAAAAVVAVNEMFGGKLTASELILAGLESEAKVSGYHIAPAIMGGFVLVRSPRDPLELVSLKFPSDKNLCFVLVNPEFEVLKAKMWATLPSEISMTSHLWNSRQAGALVAAVLQGDSVGFGKALSSDKIVQPRWAYMISGLDGVKKAAMEAGAFGFAISGSDPTAVAVIDDEEKGREIGEKMVEAFMVAGNSKAVAVVNKLDRAGARLVSCSSI